MRSDFVDLFLSALSRCDIDSQDKVTLSILKHFHKSAQFTALWRRGISLIRLYKNVVSFREISCKGNRGRTQEQRSDLVT